MSDFHLQYKTIAFHLARFWQRSLAVNIQVNKTTSAKPIFTNFVDALSLKLNDMNFDEPSIEISDSISSSQDGAEFLQTFLRNPAKIFCNKKCNFNETYLCPTMLPYRATFLLQKNGEIGCFPLAA